MAASFKSHFRHPPQRDETVPDTQRKQTSRIPTRSSNTESKQGNATPHVSKLAKRASRNISSSDKVEHGTKSTKREATPVSAANSPPVASKRASVAQRSDIASAGIPAAPAQRHNGLHAPPILRTPSLVSGSSASTFDSPHSTGLRRKPSNLDQYASNRKANTAPLAQDKATMHSRNEEYREAYDDTILGISLPPKSGFSNHPNAGLAQDFTDREWQAPANITSPVSHYAQSATPSTRYTDSPFSHVPTPSTASSYSPAIVATSGATGRPRQQSPTRSRPPITGRTSEKGDTSRLGLPPVRESSTSSSNSTVKPTGSKHAIPRKEVPRKELSTPSTNRTPGPSKLPSQAQSTRHVAAGAPTVRKPVQIPPELAHLNVELPRKPSLHKPLPPIRPSRDNTPSIADMSRPSPVVQSDLPRLYTTYHKRTPSQETPASATSPSMKSRFGLSSKTPSRQPSPRVDSAISPPPSARNFARGPTPDNMPPETRRLQRTDSPAVGPAPSPSKSPRFPFFSRKSKSEGSSATEKPKREPRKGPAAGTGHEGYGRFGIRGRSGSTTSSTGCRSPSADSNASSAPRPTASRKGSYGSSKSGSDMDDFLRERLNPVVLRGSGSTISNAASSVDMQGSSIPDSTNSSSLDSYPRPQLLPSAMRGESSRSPVKRPPIGVRQPSDSSEDDTTTRFPSLAARRSFTRLSQADAKSPVRVPAPINTNIPPKQTSIDSYDAETSAWPQTDSTVPGTEDPFEGREGLWLRSPHSQASAKPGRKWNFFQRAQASSRPKGKEKAADVPTESDKHQSSYRSVAHYAMMDPVEPVDFYELERLVQEPEISPEDSMSEGQQPSKIVPYESRHLALLPSPPKVDYSRDADFRAKPTPPRIMVRQDSSESPSPVLLRAQSAVPQQMPQVINIPRSPNTAHVPDAAISSPVSPELPPVLPADEVPNVRFGTPETSHANDSPKQPRLSPIGRIPKVVSSRDRDRKLPDKSFSRPFQRTQPHPNVRPPGALYNQIRDHASPIEPGSQPVSSTSTRSDSAYAEPKSSVNTNPPSVSTNRTSMDMHSGNEFIAFTPRKNSEVSYSSSSGGASWIAALASQPPQLDDPWIEYNDLLDDMMPQKTPLSAGSSLGAPFQYSGMLHDASSPSYPAQLSYSEPPSTELPLPPRSNTVPAVLSVPQQIARFMQPSMSPLTPHTLSDFIDRYDDRSTSSMVTPNRTSHPGHSRSSLPQPQRTSLLNARASVSSSRYSRASAHSRSASLPEANLRHSQASLTPSARFNRDTQLLDIAEDDTDEQASAYNLRLGAMMTSKWLSFGRVLFSPAHNEMSLADEPRVLIVDGLGSDWSYYVALTYKRATVYNLGPALVNGSTSYPGINQKPPPNHKHYPRSSISAPFPFPKGFFTVVVFRFPIVTTEQVYSACIGECKRVLRPGGHLEVAVLDLDLMNMGSKARRVVRGLKTRLQQRDETVSLRNISDVLVRLIGRRGFEEVQRCVVGIPTAGRIPRSQDISSVSSGHSGKRSSQRNQTSENKHKEISFADLLEDARLSRIEPESTNDEGITKMVAKVGRWWYSTCYETSLLETDKSIWEDHALLRECEKQGTSFRLLICCAQKPTQTQRRTVSF